MYNFRLRCVGGEPLLGTFCAIPHPVAVEVAAMSGLDFLCLDGEHSQMDRERIEDLVRAADLHKVPAMVRVPSHAPEWIAGALDAGAAGVLAPRVSTADQARAIVSACRYPPIGARGIGPGRATAYGRRLPDYLQSANEKITVAIQIETAEALTALDDIVTVVGVDVVFIGPGDLALSIDAMGPDAASRLNETIFHIAAVARKANKIVGIFRPSFEDMALWRQHGISFYLLASDTMALGAGLAASVSAARNT